MMINVLYYLFNSFNLDKKITVIKKVNPGQIKPPKWVGASKE